MKRDKRYITFSLNQNKDDPKILEGYAIRYNELSHVNEDRAGKWATKITPKAFINSWKKEIFAYFEHDSKRVLARTKNKSLKIEDREDGVFVQMNLGKTNFAQEVHQMVTEGLVDGMSFGVYVSDAEWTKETFDGEEIEVRNILSGEVFECTVTHNPAFPTTSVQAFDNEQDREDYLKSVEEKALQEEKEKQDKEAEKKNAYALARAKIRLMELTV